MKKQLLLLAAATALSCFAQAQTPSFAWAKLASGDANNAGGVAVDTIHHAAYVTGSFQDGINFGSGGFSGTGSSGSMYLAKYDLGGNLVWAKAFITNEDTSPEAVATDNSGNVYVTGYTANDTLRFGTHYILNSDPGSSDHTIGFLAKFDAAGNCQWLKGTDGNGGVGCLAVTTDAAGNPFITGYSITTGASFQGHALTGGAFIAKLDGSGTLQWLQQSSPAGILFVAQGNGITVDAAGNCIAAGAYADSISFGGIPMPNSNGNATDDRFVVKMNGSTGSVMWAKHSGIWQGPDANLGVASDANNNIYLTGYVSIATVDSMTSSYVEKQFVEKLDAAGVSQWINVYHNNTPLSRISIAADHAGNSFVSLTLGDTATYGAYHIAPNLPFGAGTSSVTTVVKVNTGGTVQYAKATTIPAGAFALGSPFGIALDEGNDVYIPGVLYSKNGFDSFNLDAGSGTEFTFAKLGNIVSAVNELDETPQYAVFPNPAGDLVYITNIKGKTSLRIFDISGKEVLAAQPGNATEALDVSALSNGIYFIELTTTLSHVTQKLVIAK